MDAEELDKQFEATDFDKSGNVIPPSTPPAAAKKKRITVADLNKTMDELTELVDTDIYGWLDKLDIRMRHFENAEAENLPLTSSITTERFKRLEDFIGNSTVKEITELKARLDALEGAIGAIADAFRLHLEEVSGEQPAAAQEIEFAKPPTAAEYRLTQTGDIAAVASVCLTMNDVLMICRALRDSPDLEAMDKNEILNIACKSAGVQVTHGIQIRAGIHERGA